MTSKLTLSVDKSIISRAKRYAQQSGVSLSEMVGTYLAMVSEPSVPGSAPPVLRSVRGILKKAPPEKYKEHLVRKYR